MLTCPSCREDYRQYARFCAWCGVRLVPRDTPPDEARKLVTAVSCGLDGSARLDARMDPETYQALLGRYHQRGRAVLERHGGTVMGSVGDAIVAVFGSPTLHEDDALRAATAADRLQSELHGLDEELEQELGVNLVWRIGANTGEVLMPATGDPTAPLEATTEVAGRIRRLAWAREILISDETYHLVREAVRARPIQVAPAEGGATWPVWHLDVVDPEARDKGRHARTPLIGREWDLELLRVTLRRAITQRRCHIVTVVGGAGIGKTRLVDAFTESTGKGSTGGRVRVLRGSCRAYGEGIGYRPFVQMVRRLAGVEPEHGSHAMAARLQDLVRDRRLADAVARILGAEDDTADSDARWELLSFFAALSRRRPLVLVVDDLHWANAELIEMLGHLAEWSRDAPILLTCVGRPELWVELLERSGTLDAIPLRLPPLDTMQTEELVGQILRQGQVPPELPAWIARTTAGYPLFVEELLHMLRDDGSLRLDGDQWVVTGDLDELRLPPSLHALLAARLEELTATERRILGRAAVMRWPFPVAALAALSAELTEDEVRATVLSLARKELLRPGHVLADPPGADRFTFRLTLLRDAAYRSVPVEARAELHQRYADWIEQQDNDRPAEVAEMVGYHLKAAHRLWTELGRSDEATDDLARRAGEWLWKRSHRARSPGSTLLTVRGSWPGPREVDTIAGDALQHLAEVEEIDIGFRRPDGSSGSTPVWVVRVGDDTFVRSMNGSRGGWYRRLRADPDGEVRDGSHAHPVRAEPVTDAATVEDVTSAYATKYSESPYVGSLLHDEAAGATLRLQPR